MAQSIQWQISCLLAVLCSFSPLNFAYEVPLESRSVRGAYFLGQRNDEKTDAFLEMYARHFTMPPQGPYISEIRLLTPYAQSADISRHKTFGYSAQQAQAEYKTRGNSLFVRVRIDFTPTYNYVTNVKPAKNDGSQPNIAPRTEDFWKDFRFLLTQNGDSLRYRNVSAEPQYGLQEALPNGTSFPGTLVGAYINLDYDARDVPSRKTQVEVFTPDGQHIVATFDLAALRRFPCRSSQETAHVCKRESQNGEGAKGAVGEGESCEEECLAVHRLYGWLPYWAADRRNACSHASSSSTTKT